MVIKNNSTYCDELAVALVFHTQMKTGFLRLGTPAFLNSMPLHE